ncbi:MAG: hypothetical protein QM723_18535 [Myxococcaceae bacterium]
MATQLVAASTAVPPQQPTPGPFGKPGLNQTIYWDDLASTYEYRPYLVQIKSLNGSTLVCTFVSLATGVAGAQTSIDLSKVNHAWGDPAMDKQLPTNVANQPGKCAVLFLVETYANSLDVNAVAAGGTGKWPLAGSSTMDAVLKLYAKQLQELMKNDDRLTPAQKETFDKWVSSHAGAMGVVHIPDPAQL